MEEVYDDTFTLDSQEKVEWALRKIGAWSDEEARVKAQSKAILDRIAGEKARFLAYFEGQLEAWARDQIKDGKRRSVDTVYGTLAFRKVPQHLSLLDKEKAFEWATMNARTALTEVLDTKAYAEYAKVWLEQTGEVAPGMELKPERDSFGIRFKGEKE